MISSLAPTLVALLLLSGPAAPVTTSDPILEAMQAELTRSMAELQLEKLQKPYFIEYALTDFETLDLAASFGALVQNRRVMSRPLRTQVRVGTYDLDNSNFVGGSSWSARGRYWGLVQGGDTTALRRDLWLATDASYKQAVEQLARKQAALQNRTQTEPLPDFAHAQPVNILAGRAPVLPDEAAWRALVIRLSAIFREFPQIQESRVSLHLYAATKYLANSEGTVTQVPITAALVVARASTQAKDGMGLRHFVPFFATTAATLPSEAKLAAGIRKMASELAALAVAPTVDKYIGPVLFSGQAATEIFFRVLASQLSGERAPLVEDQRFAASVKPRTLAERLGRRVLPAFLSVVDDASATQSAGEPLFGGYAVDDEGVVPEVVTLVDKGFLRSLEMSRRPRKEMARSNGHGRAAPSGLPSPLPSNLIVKAAPGASFAALKQALIAACKEQGQATGLLVTLIDNPALSGRDPAAGYYGFSRGGTDLPDPILVYRVDVATGREELVRGLKLGELNVKMLKEVTAAGSEAYVDTVPLQGDLDADGFANAVLTSIVAPSVLFEEIELSQPPGPQQKPAILTHPFFKPPR